MNDGDGRTKRGHVVVKREKCRGPIRRESKLQNKEEKGEKRKGPSDTTYIDHYNHGYIKHIPLDGPRIAAF